MGTEACTKFPRSQLQFHSNLQNKTKANPPEQSSPRVKGFGMGWEGSNVPHLPCPDVHASIILLHLDSRSGFCFSWRREAVNRQFVTSARQTKPIGAENKDSGAWQPFAHQSKFSTMPSETPVARIAPKQYEPRRFGVQASATCWVWPRFGELPVHTERLC